MRSPSKDPDDYRSPPQTAPLGVILRRIAWGVFALALLIGLYGATASYFAALPHDPDEVARNEAHARRILIVSAAVLALSVTLGLSSVLASRRER